MEQEKKNYDAGDKFISYYELHRRFTEFKQEAANRWLYTISNAVKDAVDAYHKFFKGLAKHPRYKSRKHSRPSFYVDSVKIKVKGTHVKLGSIDEPSETAEEETAQVAAQNLTKVRQEQERRTLPEDTQHCKK